MFSVWEFIRCIFRAATETNDKIQNCVSIDISNQKYATRKRNSNTPQTTLDDGVIRRLETVKMSSFRKRASDKSLSISEQTELRCHVSVEIANYGMVNVKIVEQSRPNHRHRVHFADSLNWLSACEFCVAHGSPPLPIRMRNRKTAHNFRCIAKRGISLHSVNVENATIPPCIVSLNFGLVPNARLAENWLSVNASWRPPQAWILNTHLEFNCR